MTSKNAPDELPVLSRSSIERLYSYHLLVSHAQAHGARHVSSSQLAQYLLIGDTQVRKDMAAIGITGQPKRGYEVGETLKALRRAMGLDQVHRAVICGVGKLGRALIQYSRFSEFGFKLVAAFDNDPGVVGASISDMRILPVEELEEVVRIFKVEIGILTVNVWAAQELCDRLVTSGIRAIWNFAPIHLQVPEDVLVRNEDFAGSLSVISHYLRRTEGNAASTT